MCTVTIVPLRFDDGPAGIRLACNRDELRSRLPARPPELYQVGAGWAGMPIDPEGGGTWIGVNDSGVAMTLLNAGERGASRLFRTMRSRGLVIPSLLTNGSARATRHAVEALDASAYRPFRLVVTDRTEAFEVRWDQERLVIGDELSLLRPLFFTSSSLGDALVHEPRRALFDDRLGDVSADDPATAVIDRQDAFHRHRWAERPHVSVSMSRSDARTVSFTIIELRRDRALVTYHPDAPEACAPPSVVSVLLRAPLGA
jgi:hypothetical protein